MNDKPEHSRETADAHPLTVKLGSPLVPILVFIATIVAFIALELAPPDLSELLDDPATSGQTAKPPAPAGAGNQDPPDIWDRLVSFIERTRHLAGDIPTVIWSQIFIIGVLILYALVPGLAGMIYRRAFAPWFAGSFAALYLIQWFAQVYGIGSLTSHILDGLERDEHEAIVVLIEVMLLLVLCFFRLRRHSAALIDARTKRKNFLIAGGLLGAAAIWSYMSLSKEVSWWEFAGISSLLLVGGLIFWQSVTSGKETETRSKNIVLCLDGTWNHPGTTDFGYLAETNVFKLFKMLKGELDSTAHNASRCKRYRQGGAADGETRQVAFYYHGVGNKLENSELGQLFGGAFGMGASAIVERAYLDVARVYKPGDRIFIFGFSRGAAIARLVAGAIGHRGIPMSMWTLRLLGRHWLIKKSDEKILAWTRSDDEPRRELSRHRQHEATEVPIEVLGCWDTVGSFGISKNILGIPFQRINLLKDLSVSLCVRRAYHMVALDETRDAFEPTLMEPDPLEPERIVEVWFCGNHSNIGGGYATDKLSNVTLDFLLRQISSGYVHEEEQDTDDESWGVYLNARKAGLEISAADLHMAVVEPDPRGRIRHSTGAAYSYAPRTLPLHAVIHDEVFHRMRDPVPVYAPQSVFDLNQELVEKRKAIEAETGHLHATHSIDEAERDRIRTWSDKKLSITKWSQYLLLEIEPGTTIGDEINPSVELRNHDG
ncbi:MAG: DUF2235 domain-containing protein [Pseudomonadota bacterium]